MKAITFVFFAFLSISMFGQNSGYFNQKNAFSVRLQGALPLAYFHYSSRENNVSYGSNKIVLDGITSLSYTRYLSKRIGFGFEYYLGRTSFLTKLNGAFFTYFNNQNYAGGVFSYDLTKVNLSYMTFMPKLEFATRVNNFPLGFINHIGIGYSTTKILAKDKFLGLPTNINFDEEDLIYFENNKLLNRNLDPIPCITFQYGMTISSPINKHLILNYGIRYTLNIFMPFTLNFKDHYSDIYNDYYDDYYISDRDLFEEIKDRRSRSIFSANVGLTFIF